MPLNAKIEQTNKAFSCHDCKKKEDFLDAGWHTNLPQFQSARPDHVRVESSSCCFPWRLVSFDPWHVTRSLGGITMSVKPFVALKLKFTNVRIKHKTMRAHELLSMLLAIHNITRERDSLT